MEKARQVLEGEVKSYDYFLTGQCYGFQLFRERDEQNRQKEQPANKANGNRKSLGRLKGAKTVAR